MKIGMICYPSIGGSGLIATELGKSLADSGHQVHFISYAVPFKLASFEKNIYFHSVDPINYPLFNQNLYTFSLTAKIVDVVADYELDLVHAHYSIPHSLCAHLAREISSRDFKIITTLHGTDVTIVGQNKPLYSLNKYGIEQSDMVTTVSRFQKDHTIKYFGISQDIEVIHNFVDPDVFKPRNGAAPSCWVNAGEKVIMHVSNFRPPKNPLGVIEIFARVQEKIPSKLVLVGDGPGLGEIKDKCREYDICDHVCFVGKLDNVETIIPMADCIIQPSFREAFGMVLLEAMACEVPTVSSDVDGIPEVVKHEKTGFLAGPEQYEKLANYVVEICNDDDLAERLGTGGRARASAVFGKDKMVSRYLECYEKVLNSC